MAKRNSNMRGRKPVHVEVARADEMPAGLPAPARQAAERDPTGKLLPGPGTSALARAAAKAAHEARQLGQLLGLWTPPEGHAYAPYSRLGREWRDSYSAQVAATVGGGMLDQGASSVVATAALEMAASRWLFDRGAEAGDPRMLLDAARLADASRQNLLAAVELAARAAKARVPTTDAYPWLAPAPAKPAKPDESRRRQGLCGSASAEASSDGLLEQSATAPSDPGASAAAGDVETEGEPAS